jgi:hypothetical protein
MLQHFWNLLTGVPTARKEEGENRDALIPARGFPQPVLEERLGMF